MKSKATSVPIFHFIFLFQFIRICVRCHVLFIMEYRASIQLDNSSKKKSWTNSALSSRDHCGSEIELRRVFQAWIFILMPLLYLSTLLLWTWFIGLDIRKHKSFVWKKTHTQKNGSRTRCKRKGQGPIIINIYGSLVCLYNNIYIVWYDFYVKCWMELNNKNKSSCIQNGSVSVLVNTKHFNDANTIFVNKRMVKIPHKLTKKKKLKIIITLNTRKEKVLKKVCLAWCN